MKNLLLGMIMASTVMTTGIQKSQAAEVAVGVTIGAGVSYTIAMVMLADAMMHADEALEIQMGIADYEVSGDLPKNVSDKVAQVMEANQDITFEQGYDAVKIASEEALQ